MVQNPVIDWLVICPGHILDYSILLHLSTDNSSQIVLLFISSVGLEGCNCLDNIYSDLDRFIRLRKSSV